MIDDNVLAVDRVLDSSNDIADLSSFKIPSNILKRIGELAREAYETRDGSNLEDLSKDQWTLLEEVITGFENR